jgi:hypothetical protein
LQSCPLWLPLPELLQQLLELPPLEPPLEPPLVRPLVPGLPREAPLAQQVRVVQPVEALRAQVQAARLTRTHLPAI